MVMQEAFNMARRANRGNQVQLSAITRAEKEIHDARVIDPPLTREAIKDKEKLIYVHSRFTYYPRRNLIIRNGTDIYLAEKENILLKLFVDSPDKIITNEEIKRNVWRQSDGDSCTDGSVRVLVCKLRVKLGQASMRGESEIIHGVYRVGYGLVGQVGSQDSWSSKCKPSSP
jgi:DNA-binding response OmpR family regulator